MFGNERTVRVFKFILKSLKEKTVMSYLDRDTLGMYKSQDEKGPGPSCHSVKPLAPGIGVG